MGIFIEKIGPAVTWTDGYQEWRLNGKIHREDGPARIFPNGKCEYWLDNNHIRTRGENFNSPQFKKRWKELVDMYHIKVILES